MNELMYLEMGKHRHQEMIREAERERLAKVARGDREKRAGRPRSIEPGWELRRLAGRLLKGSRARKSAGKKGGLRA